MTGHFTTLDGCERWGQIVGPASEFYRAPFSYLRTDDSFGITKTWWDYRVYKLESIEPLRGLAHYVEVK
jgi:hypothetical protein